MSIGSWLRHIVAGHAIITTEHGNKKLGFDDPFVISELSRSAMYRSYSDAWGFLLTTVVVAALGIHQNGIHIAVVIFMGALASAIRLSFKTRFESMDFENPDVRRRVNGEMIFTTCVSAIMWFVAIATIMPGVDQDMRFVFLGVLLGSFCVGAHHMVLAPPSFVIHTIIVASGMSFALWNESFKYQMLAIGLFLFLSMILYRSVQLSSYRSIFLATQLANHEKERLSELLKLRKQADTTVRASFESNAVFLAKISHEFRSPLQIISGSAELLSNLSSESNNKRVQLALKGLNAGVEQLYVITADLANYIAAKTTGITSKPKEIDLCDFLNNCKSMYELSAKEKKLDLLIDIQLTESKYIVDPNRLLQIVGNLLSNAIKYTSSGSVRITCKDKSGDGPTIEIEDTGKGIPNESLGNIFEPWYQEEGRVQEGWGLGLAIVKATADAIGAKVFIRSTLKKGTTATIQLAPSRLG